MDQIEDCSLADPSIVNDYNSVDNRAVKEPKSKDIKIKELENLLAKSERQIKKLESYNADLRNELNKVSSQLHNYRTKKLAEACTQVKEDDLIDVFQTKPMPEWGHDLESSSLSIVESLTATAEAVLTRQDPVTQAEPTADNSLDQGADRKGDDYVYDENSGLYYHPATGYYWDPSSNLFYNYSTGAYYQYDSTTGEYTLYSQVPASTQDISQHKTNENHVSKSEIQKKSRKNPSHDLKRPKRRVKKAKKRRSLSTKEEENPGDSQALKSSNEFCTKLFEKTKDCESMVKSESSGCESSDSLATGESEMVDSEVESGEISDSSDPINSDVEMTIESGPCFYGHTPQEARAQEVSSDLNPSADDIISQQAPCIRVIVLESQHLCEGSLYMVTVSGGTIGRLNSPSIVIEIPDVNVSKEHAKIWYDEDDEGYQISDEKSQNGTFLNGSRLIQDKDSCEKLSHGDLLSICGTKLLLHIHTGAETCDDCEPGQVQAKLKADRGIYNDHVVLTKAEKESQRRKEMKLIKKKYGLQNCKFDNSGSQLGDKYTDKARRRRQTVGSQPDIQASSQPASVHAPIKATNKGHKLLSKLGWKEGEGLGKNSSGISQPIQAELRVNQTAGLGCVSGLSLSLDQVGDARKAKRWSEVRQRYQMLENSQAESVSTANNSHTISDSKPEQMTDSGESNRQTAVRSWVKGDVLIPEATEQEFIGDS